MIKFYEFLQASHTTYDTATSLTSDRRPGPVLDDSELFNTSFNTVIKDHTSPDVATSLRKAQMQASHTSYDVATSLRKAQMWLRSASISQVLDLLPKKARETW